MRLLKNVLIILFLFSYVFAQSIPSRPDSVKTGSEFMEAILGTTYSQRESQIFEEIVNGNIPNILRDLITLSSTFQDANGINHIVEYDVIEPDMFLSTLFDRYNVSSKLYGILEKTKDIFDVRKIKRGQKYSVFFSKDTSKHVNYIVYEKNKTKSWYKFI